MGFIIFLLILGIFVLLWPRIRTALLLWIARRTINRFMGNMGADADDPRRNHRNSKTRQQTPPRKKVFSRDDGEYIDFEEVEVTTSTTSTTSTAASAASSEASSHRRVSVAEQQISDAEWEEI